MTISTTWSSVGFWPRILRTCPMSLLGIISPPCNNNNYPAITPANPSNPGVEIPGILQLSGQFISCSVFR